MTSKTEDLISNNSKKEVIKQEINLQYHWYLISFFLIFFGSFLIPGIVFTIYMIFFFVPFVLDISNFITLFTELNSILTLISLPFVIITCYLIHLFFVALITRWLWGITEKKSSSKEGNIPRNIPSKTLNFYHIRSFLIKYPKNAIIRGPFPWLINWLFNFVKTNKIGKGTTIEEQMSTDRFIEIGNNSYIGVFSILTAQLVEGIFGKIVYYKIKVGDNVTFGGFNAIGPGNEIKNNSYLLPMAATGKHNLLKGSNFYYGMPLRKIFTRKVLEYLNFSKEDLDKDKKIRMKQQHSKINVNKDHKEEN